MKRLLVLISSLALVGVVFTGCYKQNQEKSKSVKDTIIIPENEIAKTMEARDFERIYQGLTSSFRNGMSKEDFERTLKDFIPENTSWQESSVLKMNKGVYKAWSNNKQTKGFNVTLTENGEIASMLLKPMERYPHTDEAFTELTYSLPFKQDWFVFWGGENVLANYHYELALQRYAYDFVKLKDGYSYNGDIKKNESYYAFGQEITAPQAGKVVHVVNNIADNEPVGKLNESEPMGNVVIIEHGDGEYSYLAHLKKNSVKVQVGDTVQKGDVIGLCGNSGNSSEPHLHFQVSDGKDFMDSLAIRIKWENNLHPVQNDTVVGGN